MIPDSIFSIAALKALDLSTNFIHSLPEAVGNARNSLVELILKENQLLELPQSLSHLENLSFLDLSKNKISELHPVSFDNL